MLNVSQDVAPIDGKPHEVKRYRRFMLALLLTILAFNYVDRVALGVLLQDIKIELDLSDTQLGFLTGFAFAAFYSIMGIPLARWADRGNRVHIIALTTALWSAAVVLCGAAASFVQLLLIRIGVAVGEAGCMPPAHSLIADSFDRAERPRAVATYMLGVPLSFVIGYFATGWLNEIVGWRVTFVLLGVPGLVLAIFAWWRLKEPRLVQSVIPSSAVVPNPTSQLGAGKDPDLITTIRVLWMNRTFRHLLIAFAVLSFFGYGIQQWQPAFFIRSYGMATGELGTWLALIHGGGGFLGTYLGGELASRYAANDERKQLRFIALIYCGYGFLSLGIYLASNQYVAMSFMAISTFGVFMVGGPLFAIIQTLVPSNMRAMSIAIVYFFANLIGLGLGPLAAGVLSDLMRAWAGDESLRYALLALTPGYVWVGLQLWLASKTVRDDLGDQCSQESATST